MVGWGSTYGPIYQGVRRARQEGHDVAHIHLRYLSPFPRNLGVIYCDPAPAYEDQVESRLDAACCGDLNRLIRRGRTWAVAG